jgi:tripartite-type tricarboxylate transporter receptor subunit TctC
MDKRKALKLLSLLTVVAMLATFVAGCGATPTPAPTAVPVPTTAPTKAPVAPTAAPAAPTAAPAAPTSAPAAATAAPTKPAAAATVAATPGTVMPAKTTYPAPKKPDQTVLDFWKGKTVNLIVPHGAGGGYDTYARLIAPLIEKQLGCTIVVVNDTGAGGEVGRNKVYSAKGDGLTIGFSSGSAMVFSQASGAEGVQYDITKFKWMARALAEPAVLVSGTKGKYLTPDLLKKATAKVSFSVSGVGDDDFFTLSIIAAALKIQVNPVTGYNGAKEAALAVVANEVDVFETSIGTMLPMITAKTVVPLWVMAAARRPEIPTVPTVLEATADVPGAADLLAVPLSTASVTRVFFAPPDLPQDKYDAMEWVLYNAINDIDMNTKAAAAGRLFDYAPGTEVTKFIATASAKVGTIKPILIAALKAAQ